MLEQLVLVKSVGFFVESGIAIPVLPDKKVKLSETSFLYIATGVQAEAGK